MYPKEVTQSSKGPLRPLEQLCCNQARGPHHVDMDTQVFEYLYHLKGHVPQQKLLNPRCVTPNDHGHCLFLVELEVVGFTEG